MRDRIQAGPRPNGYYRGDGRLRGLAGRGAGGGNGNGPGGRDWRPRRKGDWWRRWTWKKALSVAGIATGTVTVLCAAAVGYEFSRTSIPAIDTAALQQSSSVYFSDGKTLVGTFGTVDRQVLSYNQIPPLMREAAVAAEDKNFYHEGGISPTGILRAAYYDLTTSSGNPQGGSTITQELVRNYYTNIGFADTLSRKLKEIFVAEKLARKYSKSWILTHYLNTVYFGQGAYGVQAAAETYFGRPVSKLDLSQMAMIAAMPQQPSVYTPDSKAGAGYQGLVYRWHYVISTMLTQGYITQQQASQARFPRTAKPVNTSWSGYRGYIMDAVRNELMYKYNYSVKRIDNGGLRVVTTFSKRLMDSLYKSVNANRKLMKAGTPPGGATVPCRTSCLPGYVHIGAMLENPANGAIEAMYAGPSYGPKHQYNYAMISRNQVGSSFKPYVLAAAVKLGMNVQTSKLNGYSPLWIPPDSKPQTFASLAKPASSGSWFQVRNDEVSNPNHPVSVVDATALSLNTAYTDLWHRVAYNPATGDHPVVDIAKAFGVNVGAYPNGSGLQHIADEAGTALGQASLTVEEQATMIATLADNGVYHTPHVVAKIIMPDMATGTSMVKTIVPHVREVLTPQEAADVDYAMSFDTTPGLGTAAGMGLTNGQTIIAKTGTTNLSQQAFFEGATPRQAMAVGMFVDKSACTLPPADQYLCTATQSLRYAPPGNVQTLFGVGGWAGYGGQWPAEIWHTFFLREFNNQPVMPWPTVNTAGMSTWNLVGHLPPPPKPKHNPVPFPTCFGNGRHCRPVPTPPMPTPTPTPTTACGFVVCPTPTPTPTSGKP